MSKEKDFYKFDPEAKRSGVEKVAGGLSRDVGFSAVRKCTKKDKHGKNEDNGIAAVMHYQLKAVDAEEIFKDIFAQVRESEPVTSELDAVGYSEKLQRLQDDAKTAEGRLKEAQKELRRTKPRRPFMRALTSLFGDAAKRQHAESARQDFYDSAMADVASCKAALKSAKKEVEVLEEEIDTKGLAQEVYQQVLLGNLSESGFMGGGSAGARAQTGATTAAGAIVTSEGVSYAGAGDSLVFLVDDAGQVILLNKLHMGGGQMITNCLTPGEQGDVDDVGSKTFEQLGKDNTTFNFKNFRVVTATDGVYGEHHSEKRIAKHLSEVAKMVDFDAPNYAEEFADASSKRLKEVGKSKADDITVLSVKAPVEEGCSVMLCAFDGVGSAGELSAQVSARAADVAEKVVRKHSARQEAKSVTQGVVDGVEPGGIRNAGLLKVQRTASGVEI